MTRTNNVALDGPHAVGAAPLGKDLPRSAQAAGPAACAAGDGVRVPRGGARGIDRRSRLRHHRAGAKTTTTPKTTPTTQTSPTSGTSPSKEASTPSAAFLLQKPPRQSSTKTLPFTGFDLRWTVGIGLLLVAMGFSIVTVQRRQRRDGGS